MGGWILGTADGYTRGYASWNGPLIDVADAHFGTATDLPVVGDWDGDGRSQLGVFRQGRWYLDANGNREWDAGLDTVCDAFGAPTDLPVAGDMDGDGVSEIGVYRRTPAGGTRSGRNGAGRLSGHRRHRSVPGRSARWRPPVTGDWGGN
jgi:hypothetical protein